MSNLVGTETDRFCAQKRGWGGFIIITYKKGRGCRFSFVRLGKVILGTV